MFFVYVLKSLSTNKLYTGQTHNLTQRFKQHNGEGKFDKGYTRNKGPWILIYKEKYSTRSEAMQREGFLKTGKGREFLQSMLVSR